MMTANIAGLCNVARAVCQLFLADVLQLDGSVVDAVQSTKHVLDVQQDVVRVGRNALGRLLLEPLRRALAVNRDMNCDSRLAHCQRPNVQVVGALDAGDALDRVLDCLVVEALRHT